MTIINNERLWAGIGIEVLLAIGIGLIIYFIFTSGRIRKEYFSNKVTSKLPLWIAVLLLLISMFLVYITTIQGAVWKF